MTDEQRADLERVERELRQSERRYAELFENATDVVFTTDLDLVFTSVNAAGEALTGYDRREARGLRVDDVLAPADRDRFTALVAGQLAGEGPSVVEVNVLTRDGRAVPLEVSVRLLVHDGRPEGVQAIGRDVSERKVLEAQLRQAQKMEAVGRLAGGVAHDFNNLLTVILGYSESLALCPGLDPDGLDDLEEIRRAAQRAADLTRQLLAFSRSQLLAPRVVDLNDIVGEMTDMIGRLVGEDVHVHLAPAPKVSKTRADPGQIAQIVMNLVVNARDAMPSGGRLTIETGDAQLDDEYAAAHPGARAGAYVRLAVSDNGVGMDAATQARIFEPFFTTKGEGKGTGLGLSTVYGIVKQSGGYIWVESEPGAGAVFEVFLPRCGDEAACAASPGAAIAHPAGTGRVLLVEDDDGVRDYVRRVLVASGYTVVAAASPAEALRKTATPGQPIVLLLTDVVMPGVNGRTLARMLAPDHPGMKVLYMSGYTSEAIVSQGVLDPSVEFLPKPFTAAELRAKVRDVLGPYDPS